MEKLTLKILLFVVVGLIVSCGNSTNIDPLALNNELEENSVPNTLSRKEKKDGWQLLFDGKTTNGWHGYNMKIFPDSWEIEDGSLTMNTTGGQESQDIITDETYRDFAFSLEYKLTPAANSGIIFQVAEDTIYKFPYETGPEFQVIDHEGWPDQLEDWQTNGANYAMYTPMAKPYKPVGEWNHLFLYVKGNKVVQILNGEVVVEYEKYSEEWNKLRNSGKWADYPDYGKYDEGHISLQNHGTKVWYRDIKLKVL
jgi:hypothetical protein